jgi:hypothetical protein
LVIESSKKEETKKNIFKYKVNRDNKNKAKDNSYRKANDSKNINKNNIKNNKTLKDDIIHNPLFKKNVISLYDIALFNNLIKKQKADSFEDAKLNEKMLLFNKKKQKSNNIFRFGQKNENKNSKNNNKLFNNKNFNALIPMTLSSSNTSKNFFPHQNYIKPSNVNNINKNNITNIHGIIYNNEIKEKLRNNFINLIQDKTQINNKRKYTNLLNEYSNGKIKAYHQKLLEQNKNFLKYEKFGMGRLRKSAQLRISSSNNSQRNAAFNNNRIKNYDKNFTPFHYQRSKSTGNFFKLGKQNKLSPKTPNKQIIFQENNDEIEKQQNINFLYNKLFLIETTKFDNIIKNEQDYKYKRSKSSKKK